MIGGNKIKLIGIWSGKNADNAQYNAGQTYYKVSFSTKMNDAYCAPCDEADTCFVDKEIYDYLNTKKIGDVITGSVDRAKGRLKIRAIFD